MSEPTCPVCREPLSRAGFTERCAKCTGAWIHEDALVGMMQERTSALVELPWTPRAGASRPCAVCAQPMEPVALGTVALDRCVAHGVWFDPEELASLLAQAKQFKVDAGEHGGLFHAIGKLFS